MTNQQLLKRLQELATEHAEISATARSAILQQQEDIGRLLAALSDIRQTSLTWAMVCPCDCTMCAKLHEAIRDAVPQTPTQSEKT